MEPSCRQVWAPPGLEDLMNETKDPTGKGTYHCSRVQTLEKANVGDLLEI